MYRRFFVLIILVFCIFFVLNPGVVGAVEESFSLSIGDRGDNVSQIQKGLQREGFYPEGELTGYFGLSTYQALVVFEEEQGFKQDGKVERDEWQILVPNSPFPSRGQSGGGAETDKTVLGYYTEYYKGDKGSYNSLVNNNQSIDKIASFDYSILPGGDLQGNPSAGVATANQMGVGALLLIHNITNSIDGNTAMAVISQAASRQKLINNISYLLKNNKYEGVNIDLEGIPASGRQHYNTFLKELKAALQKQNKLLTVSIPAKTGDNPYDNWSGAYDYKTIGQTADLVCIMTYDEHWAGGTPGPVASLPWVTKVINYTAGVMPPGKVLMGLAAYGYDWPEGGKGKAVTWKQMSALIDKYGSPKWDNTNSVPYLNYTDTVKHSVWFENSYSMGLKLDLVNKNGLGGVAFWRMGFEDGSFWDTIKSKF